MLWLGDGKDFWDIFSISAKMQQSIYIEIMQTQAKVVICTKLDPKTGGCQTWHFLPLPAISADCIYLKNIPKHKNSTSLRETGLIVRA
jgi:hypothetical protein